MLNKKAKELKLALEVNRVVGQRLQSLTSDLVNLQNVNQTLEERIQHLEESMKAVTEEAQRAMARMSGGDGVMSPDWSEWELAEDPSYQTLESRVRKLEMSADIGPTMGELTELSNKYDELIRRVEERLADLELEGPRGVTGRGVGLTPKDSKRKVVDAKAVLGLVELTDDKNKFRQWDLKFVNALTHVEKEYGWAMKRIKECIDAGGDDEEDVRIMLALADGSALGPSGLDVDQLAADLEYILVDKAKVWSDILHRIHNAMPRGAS